ncbi:MAG TPA: DUF2569 family protein [Micropepsaceae bacterium]|jgi:hypothetical protein|nr:DUF2569 family protein [Micropepsaceae bacterium]
MNSGRITEGQSLRGIGGWLLVLCIYLMGLVPLLAAVGMFAVWRASGGSAALQSAVFFEALLELGLAAFAFYAGLLLYQRRPNAVAVTKIYFITMLTLGALVLGIVLLGLVSRFADAALASQLRGPATATGIRQIVIAGLWLLYLERSARVRATYPQG